MLRPALGTLSAPRPLTITALFLLAILGGTLTGALSPAVGEQLGGFVDALVLVLVGSILGTIRFHGWQDLRRAPRTVALALILNFALIPVIAIALTALVVPEDALRLGVLIYCLFPCTDWFLGFTRLAGGDTAVGAALIPIQLVLQLALFPLWLGLFTGGAIAPTWHETPGALLTWFALPAGVALGARILLRLAPVSLRERVIGAVDAVVPVIIALLIVTLFASNATALLGNPVAFGRVLLAVFLFFVVLYAIGELIARVFGLRHAEHALLTMTTSARNAPLMLALTTAALPDQPTVAAAIVLGMLIEFPHLTALTHLLRRQAGLQQPARLNRSADGSGADGEAPAHRRR